LLLTPTSMSGGNLILVSTYGLTFPVFLMMREPLRSKPPMLLFPALMTTVASLRLMVSVEILSLASVYDVMYPPLGNVAFNLTVIGPPVVSSVTLTKSRSANTYKS